MNNDFCGRKAVKTVLVGGGKISKRYKKGFENSQFFDVVALCDKNPDCIARSIFDNAVFLDDYKKIPQLELEAAIVSVYTHKHFEIAKFLLSNGISVFCEKPLALSLNEIEELFKTAKDNNVHLECLYHWRSAAEVTYLKEIASKYGDIKRIETKIFDNYCEPDTLKILDDRLILCGAWFDSGINILSFVEMLVDIGKCKLINEKIIKAQNSEYPVFASKVFECGDTVLSFTVDWRSNNSTKNTVIEYEKATLEIDHTNQTVSLNGKQIFSSPTEDRLTSHYQKMFADFKPDTENYELTMKLHKALFEVM